jgi:hypothetical protein
VHGLGRIGDTESRYTADREEICRAVAHESRALAREGGITRFRDTPLARSLLRTRVDTEQGIGRTPAREGGEEGHGSHESPKGPGTDKYQHEKDETYGSADHTLDRMDVDGHLTPPSRWDNAVSLHPILSEPRAGCILRE